MQEVPSQGEHPQGHGNGEFEIAVSVLVHDHAPADDYQENVFCNRTPTAVGAQALPARLGDAPQAERAL